MADSPLARLEPLVLTGRVVRLEPLEDRHADGLVQAGRDESIWTWMTRPALADLDDARRYIAAACDRSRAPQLAFAIVHLASGAIAGSTRLFDVHAADRWLEIGHTWLAPAFQRTAVNTECKHLLLRHAFETLGCARVQLKTDALNQRSRAAIERIGARFEGVLRKFQLTQHGRIRDTALYSITDDDWPAVASRLEVLRPPPPRGD